MWLSRVAFYTALVLAQAAWADARPTMRPTLAPPGAAPLQSLRPVMRRPAEITKAVTVALGQAAPARLMPPQPRIQAVVVAGSALAVPQSYRPAQRPATATALRLPAGSVCGSAAIQGKRIAAIESPVTGCGVAQPVQVTAIAGVRLTQAATIDCTTAQALETWIETGARAAVGRTGGGLAALRVAAHYTCRPRNNKAGARISEHGRGRAIDISGLILADGTEITVKQGWRGPKAHRDILRKSHQSACGAFGTVLGPDGDRYHQDHLHFDTARYRSGAFCR